MSWTKQLMIMHKGLKETKWPQILYSSFLKPERNEYIPIPSSLLKLRSIFKSFAYLISLEFMELSSQL